MAGLYKFPVAAAGAAPGSNQRASSLPCGRGHGPRSCGGDRSAQSLRQRPSNTPKGSTALFDAIYAGLEKIGDARHHKKGLIIISDGEDNHSRYSFSELKELAQESDAQIYIIGEQGEIGYGRALIGEIEGNALPPGFQTEMQFIAAEIARADHQINEYFFTPALDGISVQDLGTENMMTCLDRVEKMARKLHQELDHPQVVAR